MILTIFVILLTSCAPISNVNADSELSWDERRLCANVEEETVINLEWTLNDKLIDNKVSETFLIELHGEISEKEIVERRGYYRNWEESGRFQGKGRNQERVRSEQRRHCINFTTCGKELGTELAAKGCTSGFTGDVIEDCDINVNTDLFLQADFNSDLDLDDLIMDDFDFQRMSSKEMLDMIEQAEAASEGYAEDDGALISRKSMMQFYNFVALQNKETVKEVNQTISGVETKLTKQMEQDKADLKKEIESKNQENRKVINDDVTKQIAQLDDRMRQERDEDRKKREEDRKKIAELTDLVNNVNSTSQNNILNAELMREKLETGIDVFREASASAQSYASSVASQSSLSSARVNIPLDDPRREEFRRKVNECRRTVVLLVGGIPVYNGTDCAGNELAYYLGKFNNDIMQGLYGIKDRRAVFYLDQIEDHPTAFQWRRPEIDRSTGEPKIEDGKASATKFYIRFKNTKSKYDFEDEKRHLHSQADITVIGFFPKCFKEKHEALKAEGKKWKEIQLKSRSWAQFKVCYDNSEDEIYLDVRTRRGGVWSRITTDLPSLLKMSLVHFKDVNSDGYRNYTEEEVTRRREEFRRLNETRKTLPRVEPSAAVKRSFEAMDVSQQMLDKFAKKSRGRDISNLAAITNNKVNKHKKLPNLDSLVDSTGKTSLRVKHYFANRDKIIRTLQTNNKSPNYTCRTSDPKIVDGKKTKLFKAVTIQVPTALLLVSAKRFLKWTDNKHIDVGPAHFISISKADYATDRDDMPVELRIHFVNSRNHSNTACAHIYFTKSKILCQGGSELNGTTFCLWLWENVVKVVLDEAKVKDATEINVTAKTLAETVKGEKLDGRLKGSTRKGQQSKSKGSPKSGASNLLYNFGNVVGPKVTSAPKKDVVKGKEDRRSDVGNIASKEKNVSVEVLDTPDVDVGDKGATAIDDTIDQELMELLDKDLLEDEREKLIEEDRESVEEVERGEKEKTVLNETETPSTSFVRRRLDYSSAERLDRIEKEKKSLDRGDFVSDDYTGVNKTVIMEIPFDLITRFKYIFETFTTGVTEIQAHLMGYRTLENNVTIVTVTEMVIPQQSGTIHGCKVIDRDFLKNLTKENHVALLHIHPEGGVYQSGEDCHTTADFVKRTENEFLSGVYDPVSNEFGFMRIKDTKVEHVVKCKQLTRIYETEDHPHPDAWAFVAVREIETPVIICDMRAGTRSTEPIDKSKIFGPVDPAPIIRNLQGDPWTPLSKEAFLTYHKEMKDAGLESLRKPFVGEASAAEADRPRAKVPGDKHWDEKYLELTIPVEDFAKPEQGHETVKGLLVQKRKDYPPILRPGVKKTTSEPDIEKLLSEMERLNSVCADLSQANVGLQSELTRMKETATIFGSTTFEELSDHSLIARVLSVFGKAMTSGMSARCQNCDWFGKLLADLDENKGKVKDILVWLNESSTDKQKPEDVEEKDGEELAASCKSLRGIKGPDKRLRVVSWNMNGHSKTSELTVIISEVQPDLILLQETKLNASSLLKFQSLFSETYYFISKTAEDDAGVDDIDLESLESSGGVTIMWKKSINSKVMKVDVDFASSVAIILNTGLKKILLLSVYAPCFGKDRSFSKHLDNLSLLFNKEEAKYDEILAVGDWNISDKSSEARKEEVQIWCMDKGLMRMDAPCPTHRHFVWKHTSFLDCAYTNSVDVEVTNTDLTIETTSDHQPITVEIKIDTEVRNDGGASNRIQTYPYEGNLWKFDKDRVEELNKELSRQLAWSESFPEESTDARLININRSLVRAHNKVMSRKIGGGRRKGLYGLAKEKRILQFLKQNKGRDEAMTAQLNLQLNDIRSKRRFAEQKRIFKKFKENPTDIFKFVSKLKGRGPGTPDKLIDGEETFYDSAAFEKIVMHYDILGKHTHPLYNEDAGMNQEWISTVTKIVNMVMNSDTVKEDKIAPVSMKEFKEIVTSFPRNKASDLDGVSHDMFGHLDDDNLGVILKWVNDLIKKDCFLSPELSKSRFSLLYKSGPSTSLGNYRRLTVSSIMLRIIERILLRRGMIQKIEDSLEDQQFGFRKNRSYTMPLLEVSEMIRRHRQDNKPLFILSTDVAKAFPRQDPRVNLLEMIKRGFSGGELKFCRDTYLGRTSHLKVEGTVLQSPMVLDSYGETEGGMPSTGRASANFDIVTKAVNSSTLGVTQLGYKVEENEDGEDNCSLVEVKRKVPARLQADDALYSLNTIHDAAACWKIVLRESKFSRCHYNEKKCFILALNVDQDVIEKVWKEKQEKEGIKLGLASELKYLGLTLSGKIDMDVCNVIAKIGGANGNLRLIAGCGLNNQQLCEPRLRISMVYSYVVSKCLAGLDSLRLSNQGEEKLRMYGDSIMRAMFFVHSNASTHLLYLVSGKCRLNVLWRLSQLNLCCRVMALNNQLAEMLRWDFVHETKNSWIYQVTLTVLHYGIKDFDRLILGNVLTPENCKDTFKCLKEIIIEKEFEQTKRRLLSQKWINNFDLSSVAPAKMSRHLQGAKSIQEIRGITCQLQFLANSYLTFSVTNKNSPCVSCKEPGSFDSPSHFWKCSKAKIAKSLRKELQTQLPSGHPAASLPVDSAELTLFVLDPESELLFENQLIERPVNFERIRSLCRLICHFTHQNRARAIRQLKKSEINFWKNGNKRSPGAKKSSKMKNFLLL